MYDALNYHKVNPMTMWSMEVCDDFDYEFDYWCWVWIGSTKKWR